MPNEQDLKSLEQKLLEANVDHKMWIEQPENFPTCLAVRPYPKEQVQKYFKKFKLFKDWKKTIFSCNYRPTLTDEYTGKSRIIEEIYIEIKVTLSKNVSGLVKYS